MHGDASRARARGDGENDPLLHRLYTVFCACGRRCAALGRSRKLPKNPPRVVQERVDRPFFSMETTRDPLFTPKNPVQSNQQPSKSGVNPVCGTARRAAPVRRNDRVGRSVASGAGPSLYRDGGNAARVNGVGGSIRHLGGVFAPIPSSPRVDSGRSHHRCGGGLHPLASDHWGDRVGSALETLRPVRRWVCTPASIAGGGTNCPVRRSSSLASAR